MNKKAEISWPEHPLFPAEEGDEPQRIEFIQVIRHENGKSQMIPRTFRADELQSVEDIFNLWGGGYYELQGRRSSIADATKLGRLSGNRRVQIPGVSKPLVDGQFQDAASPATSAPVSAPSSELPIPTSLVQLAPIFAQLWTQHQAAKEAREERDMQRRREEEERRRQDDIRREERARAEAMTQNQLMIQLSSQANQSMATMVTAVLARSGGTDEFAKMADLIMKLRGVTSPEEAAGGEGDGGLIDKLVELSGNVADAVQGGVKLKEAGGAVFPGSAPPPGSAAALMGVPMVRKPEPPPNSTPPAVSEG